MFWSLNNAVFLQQEAKFQGDVCVVTPSVELRLRLQSTLCEFMCYIVLGVSQKKKMYAALLRLLKVDFWLSCVPEPVFNNKIKTTTKNNKKMRHKSCR
jgi:hypothetical protein